MSKPLLLAAALVLSLGGAAGAQETTPPAILGLGDAVVTGFSGTLVPDPAGLPPGSEALDETLIDVEGISARILSIAAPGYVWDGRAWAGQNLREFLARDLGQVFGVALDDAESPNIYLAATSAYGLPIVAPDADGDGRPERLREGAAGAQFMEGLFGPGPDGGPGSIWKVDGVTGAVSLFATVMLDGAANPGPGLGNIAYDAVHSQLFVSDRSTGMIHRFGLDGDEMEIYDHGVTGRAAAGLPTVAYDPAGALDITRGDFDTEDPDSWGFAAPDRRVWGLGVHDGRLYYAVIDDSQIWSVGIDEPSGAFASDPRWELDVPKRPAKLPVSDIVFTKLGAMILAQRGEITSTYDHAGFAEPGDARLYRYWLESPDDPQTPSRWIEEPEEYAVGFGGDNRLTAGGVDLEYGFNRDGLLDLGFCEASLLTTGDDLRLNPDLADALLPGGPLAIDGLQGMPAGPVKPENTPPWASYMIDLDPVADDADVDGHAGDVAVYRRGCGGELPYVSEYGGAGYPSDPPYISGPEDPDYPEDPEDPDFPDDPEDPEICAEADCPPPEFEILKTCNACAIDPQTGMPSCQCQITVTSNGAPFPGNLSVNESVVFGGSTPFNDTIASVSSTDSWTCDQPPFAPADPALCAIGWPGLTAAGNNSTIDVTIELPDPGFLVETKNCATLSLDGEELDQSCTDFTGEDSEEIDVSLTKSYEPDPVVQGTGTYTLTITNEGAPFDPSDAISITDEVPAGITISSASGADWDCAPLPITGPATLTCVYTGTAEVGTGFTSQVVLTAATESVEVSENCAAVGIDPMSGYEDSNSDNNRDCADFTGEDDGFDVVRDPPDLEPLCGTNVIFVVDESRSIADANATYYITNALTNAAAMYNANGSQAAVIRFSDAATVTYPMATATYASVNAGYNPAAGGGTNWEAAMLAALGLMPSPNTIIVFITDGTPTAYLDAGSAVTYTTDSVLATNEAIAVVNQIYALGTPIVGIGIGNVSTHLNALLGGNSQVSSFSSLDGDLAALGRRICPDLYLRKQISPGYLDFHNATGDLHTTVTLTATNTSTATLNNVTVEDALPAELTNPTGLGPSVSVTGSTVSWIIASLPAGASTQTSFDVIVSPNPAPTAQWRCFANYAQVTDSGGPVNSTPNNMADATNGPVHEHDEASSSVCVTDYTPVPPVDCGSSYLWVTKKAAFAEVCVPGGSPDCTFNITVSAQCKDFNGPVLFGDGVSNGGTPVAAPIASITNTATPPICAWSADWTGTTTPSSCTASIALPVNQSISFTVTLAAPLPVGSGYTNCFVADGKPTLPADYDAAVADVGPTTAPNGGVWGNCAPFSVAASPQLAPQQPEPETITCRAGTSLKKGACLPDRECQAPAKPNSTGTACICPDNTIGQGTSCVAPESKPIACNPPAVPNSKGTACICPKGTIAQGDRCVTPEAKPLECRAPAVPNRKGTACVCPKGTVAAGGRCITPEIPKEIIQIPKLELPGGLFEPKK